MRTEIGIPSMGYYDTDQTPYPADEAVGVGTGRQIVRVSGVAVQPVHPSTMTMAEHDWFADNEYPFGD